MTTSPGYKSGTVTVTVDYGYDIHSISFSGRTMNRISAGKPLTIRGQGFHWDGSPDQDIWSFNANGTKGNLYVYTEGGGEIYIGNMDDGEVWIQRGEQSA